MAYGMAKWDWVTAEFPPKKFQFGLAEAWIGESYRFTAPKKLLSLIDSAKAAVSKRKPSKRPRRK
jgi:hypothetical protein